jgi:hypothetical protein
LDKPARDKEIVVNPKESPYGKPPVNSLGKKRIIIIKIATTRKLLVYAEQFFSTNVIRKNMNIVKNHMWIQF